MIWPKKPKPKLSAHITVIYVRSDAEMAYLREAIPRIINQRCGPGGGPRSTCRSRSTRSCLTTGRASFGATAGSSFCKSARRGP